MRGKMTKCRVCTGIELRPIGSAITSIAREKCSEMRYRICPPFNKSSTPLYVFAIKPFFELLREHAIVDWPKAIGSTLTLFLSDDDADFPHANYSGGEIDAGAPAVA